VTVEAIRVSRGWLDLREGADAAARSRELVGHLCRRLPAGGPWVIHDLACGSGAMGRWLAPLLPGPQRWVLHDRDPDLLALAESAVPGSSADGAVVTVETRLSDVTQLDPEGALEMGIFNMLVHAGWNLQRFRTLEAQLESVTCQPHVGPV